MQDHSADTYMVNLFDGPYKCKNSTIFLQGEKTHENKQLTLYYAKQLHNLFPIPVQRFLQSKLESICFTC